METKDKQLAEESPELARLIEQWPHEAAKSAVWQVARLAYDFGFGRGITHGLEQSSKIMSFAFEKLNQSFDRAYGKAGDKVQPPG